MRMFENEGNPVPEKKCTYLRTGNTEAALETMDCTEFMMRFVTNVFGLTNTLNATSDVLATYASEDNCYGDKFCFVTGSEKSTFDDIRPGDMFLWRNSGDGHVGVVESYNKETDKVTILEAITKAIDENDCDKDCNGKVCRDQVRRSIYKRTSKSLNSHDGWKGYFRIFEN